MYSGLVKGASTAPHQETTVLALIKAVCTIKRNPIGLFNTHSENEFHQLLQEKKPVQITKMEQISFSIAELQELGAIGSDINKLINSKANGIGLVLIKP